MLPHSMGPGGGAEGVGEKGQDRFHPRTPCPFPVRTARLIPNLPLSLLTGLGKPPGTQQRFPGVQAGGRAGTEAAHAETRRPAPPSGKVEAAKRAHEAPDPHISAPEPRLPPASSIRPLADLLCAISSWGLLPPFYSFFLSYLFIFNNEFLITHAIDEYVFLLTHNPLSFLLCSPPPIHTQGNCYDQFGGDFS